MNTVQIRQEIVSLDTDEKSPAILMSAELFLRFLRQASAHHAIGLKSFGVFLSQISAGSHERCPTDVFFCDSRKNRRNDPEHRPGFESQGAYFRRHSDAGFVADAGDMLHMEEMA